MSESSAPNWPEGQKVFAGDMFLGLYQPSPETAGFWEGVQRRELLFKYCGACERHYHPRRIVCPQCSSTALSWKAASGKGKVYSYSEVHRAPTAAFAKSAPYTVGLIETVEGVHWFCRIVAERGRSVTVDAPAALEFRVLENGHLLPVFVLTGEADR